MGGTGPASFSKEYVSDWLPEKKNNIALIYAVAVSYTHLTLPSNREV